MLVIFALVALFFFALPTYISSESFQKLIVKQVNGATDGTLEVGKLDMNWFGGISLTDLSYVDRDGRLSISAKSIFTKPSYGSIIFGRPAFGRTIIEQPDVKIHLAETPPAQSEPSEKVRKTGKQVKSSLLPVEKIELVVKQGR